MPGMNSRSLRLLASTSLIGLSLAAAPLSVEFSLEQPILKMAQAKCCFAAGTSILMADGSTRPIESIQIGDLVMGGNGRANRVVEIERPMLGPRRLYALNGGKPFVTAEHPFMTTEGWKAIDPARTAVENPSLSVQRLCPGDRLVVLRPTRLAVLDNLALAPEPSLEPVVLLDLRGFEASPHTPLFNLLLDGDHAYFANRYLVHNKDGDDSGSGGGGEGGESGSGSSGSGSSGSSGSGSGGSGEGGESGNSGSGSGESGEGGESGSSGSSNSGSGKSGSGGKPFFGDLEQVGPDLSKDEEAAAISKGWQ